MVLRRVLGEHFFQTGRREGAQCPPERQRLRAALTSPVLCASMTHPGDGGASTIKTHVKRNTIADSRKTRAWTPNTATARTILIFISKSIYMLPSRYYRNTEITFAKQLVATCVYISSEPVFP